MSKTIARWALCVVLVAQALFETTQAQQPVKFANLGYGSFGQVLDVYVPTVPVKRTAILFIHGGGFKQGSKDEMALYAMLFAQGGVVSVSMDYRLTPSATFPAPVVDVVQAIAWMRSQSANLHFDPRKIILVGYSAGGNLALMAGLLE